MAYIHSSKNKKKDMVELLEELSEEFCYIYGKFFISSKELDKKTHYWGSVHILNGSPNFVSDFAAKQMGEYRYGQIYEFKASKDFLEMTFLDESNIDVKLIQTMNNMLRFAFFFKDEEDFILIKLMFGKYLYDHDCRT